MRTTHATGTRRLGAPPAGPLDHELRNAEDVEPPLALRTSVARVDR